MTHFIILPPQKIFSRTLQILGFIAESGHSVVQVEIINLEIIRERLIFGPEKSLKEIESLLLHSKRYKLYRIICGPITPLAILYHFETR